MPSSLVMPVKGANTLAAPPLGTPAAIEIVTSGKRKKKHARAWPVGDHVLKMELYGLLGLEKPTDEQLAEGKTYPAGYVHLSKDADEEFCKQMVGEEWMADRGEWKRTHANEGLDGWKYARAAALLIGVDRMREAQWLVLEAQLGVYRPVPAPEQQDPEPERPHAESEQDTAQASGGRKSKWLGRKRGSWLRG